MCVCVCLCMYVYIYIYTNLVPERSLVTVVLPPEILTHTERAAAADALAAAIESVGAALLLLSDWVWCYICCQSIERLTRCGARLGSESEPRA